MRTTSSILFSLMTLALTLGTQSCTSPAEVSLTPMLSATRLDRPAAGKNKVWVEYQDLSAQGAEFEEAILDGLKEEVGERGYANVNLPEEADWILWATTRIVDRVESEERFNQTLASLGAVTGAFGGSIAGNAIGGWNGAWIGAAGGGGLMGWIMRKLTQENAYICVTDLQLGSRRAEEMQVSESSSTEGSMSSVTGAGITQTGGIATMESASTRTTSDASYESVRRTVFAEKEQRLLLTAKGTRMSLDQAKEMMIPKLIQGVGAQIPKYRGN